MLMPTLPALRMLLLLLAAASSASHGGISTAAGHSSTSSLDTMTFMGNGSMAEADLVHGFTTAFSPPGPCCVGTVGPKGSPVYWEGLRLMDTVFRKYNLPGWYTELPDCGDIEGCKGIWERQKYPYKKSGLNANWEANLAELIAVLRPFVNNGTITGVFLGDELVDQGVFVDNVTAVAKRLRAGLGPNITLSINICPRNCSLWPSGCEGNGWKAPPYNPADPSSYNGHLPAEIDLVSFDGYNWTNGTTEFEKHKEFIENQVLPGLLPHQRVLLCPGTFVCSNGAGAKMSFDEQQDQIVAKLRLMYEWALNTPQIAGFIPWHLSNRNMAPRPDCDMGLGAVAMPRVMSELREIGTLIKRSSKQLHA